MILLTHPEYLKTRPQIEEKQIITAKGGWQRIAGCFIADSSYNYLLVGNFNSADSTEYNIITDQHDLKLAYYFIDDVNLTPLPYKGVSLLNSSVPFCHDQEFVEIDAFVEGALSYEWENGETNHRIRIPERKTKDYTVKICFNECIYRHSFRVFYYPDIDLGQDTVLCDGEELLLQPQHPIKNYKWVDGSSDTFRIVSTSGIYSVSVPSPCTIDDSIEVKFLNCPGFIPNVITPNGDSYNPTLSFENLENRNWSLEIFNRWGTPVFFAKRYHNNWDGEGLTDGIYYYILKSTDLNKEVRGFVQIIRTVTR